MNEKQLVCGTKGKLAKYGWLVALLAAGAFYYSFYVFSVISPQTGWWQYMAQRLNDGELLYKDVFMYVPPYFAWLTALLYKVFDKYFICYTIFGLVFFRMVPWTLLYLTLTRFAKPYVAAIAVLLGVCVTSSYLMDMPYDYNPMLMALTIAQGYFALRLIESQRVKESHIWIFLEGLVCGMQIMLKQNIGIIMPIVLIPLCTFIFAKLKHGNWLHAIASIMLGIVVGALPGLVYLIGTGTLDDCWYCITAALQAKMGDGNILLIAINNFIEPANLVVAISAIIVVFLGTSKKQEVRRHLALGCSFFGICLAMQFSKYLHPFLGFLNLAEDQEWLILAIVIAYIAIITAIIYLVPMLRKNTGMVLCSAFFVVFILGIKIVSLLPDVVGYKIYYFMDWYGLKTDLLYTMLYLDIFFWFSIMYKGFVKKDELAAKYALVYIVFFGFMAVSFASAVLEELYALLLTPGVVIGISDALKRNEMKNSDATVTNRTRAKRILVPLLLMLGSGIVCMFCFLQKVYMPYEWHSWRTQSLMLGERNPVVSVNVEGLEGYRLAQTDAQTYEEIVRLIKENSTEDDKVYQFPNIPLFNVLAERKAYYAAIPYFDVCPDNIAIENAQQLYADPPKMFIWADLSEERWNVHEEVYRNGNPSGQREIMKFYHEVVATQYTCLGVFDNNEGETIQVWLRND